MRKKSVQMSLSDIYNDVSEAVENKKPKVIPLLEEHIDFENIIPEGFYRAFYSRYGRNNIYHLESYIRVLLLQKILGIPSFILFPANLLISISNGDASWSLTNLYSSRYFRSFCR